MADQGSDQGQPHQDRAMHGGGRPSGASTTRTQRSRSRGPTRNNRQREGSSSSRQFLFIDANTDRNASSEAVRVHVMREAHRTRRERSGAPGQAQGRRAAAQDEMVIFDTQSTSSRPSPVVPDLTLTRERSSASATPPVIDWPSVIRTGATDLSVASAVQLYRLAEGYLRSVRLIQPDVLQLCRGDLLPLSAYLALAALQLGSNDQESANVASVQFEARALELLRLRITESAQMHADTTIVAVLLLSRLEEFKDNEESALFHRNALRRLIQDRGGLQILQAQSPDLYNILVSGGFVEHRERQ